jgi:hypothetical protein
MHFIIKVVAALAFFFSLQTSFAQTVNIKKTTRKAVADLQKEFPKFKMDPELQACLDGLNKDPYCDEALQEEVTSYRKNQQLDAKNQQLEIVEKANQGIEIVIGLIQLGMYVDYGKVPNPQANFIEKVQQNKDAPKDVLKFFYEAQNQKTTQDALAGNLRSKRIIDAANMHLMESVELQKRIVDDGFKVPLIDFTNNARIMLNDYRKLKERSAPK